MLQVCWAGACGVQWHVSAARCLWQQGRRGSRQAREARRQAAQGEVREGGMLAIAVMRGTVAMIHALCDLWSVPSDAPRAAVSPRPAIDQQNKYVAKNVPYVQRGG